MDTERGKDILIGPRTTVYTLLQAYPFLEAPLRRMTGFERLTGALARSRWARVTTIAEIAIRLNVPWRRILRDIADEVEKGTGRRPRVSGPPRRIAGDERRLGELRDIVHALEGGGSLWAAAEQWRAATADLEPAESAALEEALSGEAAAAVHAGDRRMRQAAAEGKPASFPPGHPLDLLRREAELLRQLRYGLEAELDRLGGAAGHRRWAQEKPLVARLVDRLARVELRFRRVQQAWFPALSVHGVEGPQALLVARQAEALETLRRVRLAVEGDDTASTAEAGALLLEQLDELLALDERLLEPPALRHFSAADWMAVRELEDGVGWALVRPPLSRPEHERGQGRD